MRRHGWFAWLITFTALGCGTEAGIFSDGGTGTGGETSGTGGDTSATSSAGGEPSTSSTGGAPTTSSTGGAPSTSSSTGGVGGTGGEPSTGSSTGTGGDMLPPVDCDGTTCKVDDDGACCWDNYEIYGEPQGECVQGTVATDGCQTFAMGEPQAPGAETRIECQTNVHCGAAETCCGELRSAFAQGQQIFFYESVTCQQNCGG
ncbi:MAG TPA: hypothetical protein ENK57_17705, partial [Polyangiaceae bacterium]|nr:hypothetical protein [Polyangiaceae bacterium]